MAGPVYTLGMGKFTEAYYQLSEEERESFFAKVRAFAEQDGQERIFTGVATIPGDWDFFGVEEYPDLEALHKHQQHMIELGLPRYLKSMNIVATKWEPPS